MRILAIIVGVLMVLFGGGCIATIDMAGGIVVAMGLPLFAGGIALAAHAWNKPSDEPYSTGAGTGIIIAAVVLGIASIVAVIALLSLWAEFG